MAKKATAPLNGVENGNGVAKKPRSHKRASVAAASAPPPIPFPTVAEPPPEQHEAKPVHHVETEPTVMPDAPPRLEGLHAGMIVGLPQNTILRLEPATFPSTAKWMRGPTGLVMGIMVEGTADSIISYVPAPIPTVNGARKLTVFVALDADRDGPEAMVELRFMSREGKGLAIPSKVVPCAPKPVIAYPIPLGHLGRTLTLALAVRPRGNYPVVVHAVWAEVEA